METKRVLEGCLMEFYAPQTSNTRKREIEFMLDQFLKESESWKQALFCLKTDSNDFLTMYCQSVLENMIKTRWQVMSPQDQSEVKTTLYTFIVQRASTSSPNKCEPFIRNKMVKLLSDIGKLSWPQQQPDFFSNVLQAMQSQDTVVIGLWFVKTISEEWTNVGDEASAHRKVELKANLIKEVPNVFKALEGILDAGIKHKQSQPTGSQNHIDEVISLALDSAAHLCSWVTLDGSLPGISQGSQEFKAAPFQISFIELLCKYCVINFEPEQNIQLTAELSHAMKALSVLNEICYRKYIPHEFKEHILLITHFGIELLNKLLNRTSSIPLSELYLEKVIEFLCLIASSHFNQFGKESAKAFLSLLLPFTFRQTETSFYYECLDIWGRLLDHVNTRLPVVSQWMDREDYIETFKQPILALANGIVHSTAKYQVSAAQECVDLEDDEIETPSLTRNIDILVKVGELLPTESLESLITTWADSCRYFGSLQSLLDPTSKSLMHISNSVDIEHFHFIVQLIGRMANIFYSDVFKQEVTLGKSLFQQLVGVYNFSQRFYFVKEPEIIRKMNCEILSSLHLWTYWLQRFHSEVILGESTQQDQEAFFEMLGILTEVVFFTLENQAEIHTSILIANLNFFLTLVTCVRTQFIFQMSPVQTLIQKVHLLKDTTNPEAYRILNKIVAASFLLAWQSVSQQEWETRTQLYQTYMKIFLEDFVRTSAIPNSVVLHLTFLQDQLDLLVTENAISKKICWNVLKEVIPFLHKLSGNYLRQPKVSEALLSFFSKIMEVLRQQAGAPFFENTIHGFLSLFSSESIINDLLQETESSSVVVEKFLEMLQFIVKEPSPSFKKFLGDSLSICYDHIYPILSQRPTPDLKIPFFTLIRDTLIYRWNYFFPTLALQARNAGSPTAAVNESQPVEEEVIRKRLDQIIQSIGNSFLQQDLEVFRYNLNTLSIWNEKHNFYSKLPGNTIQQFVRVILQILLHKTHDLYREEMIRVLHDLASVDYTQFRTTFLQEFIQSSFSSIPVEQSDALLLKFKADESDKGQRSPVHANQERGIDLPTFNIVLNGFIDELRHFHFLIECQKLTQASSTLTNTIQT